MSETHTCHVTRHIVKAQSAYQDERGRNILINVRRADMRNEIGGKVMDYLAKLPGGAATVYFHESEQHEGRFLILKTTAMVKPCQ